MKRLKMVIYGEPGVGKSVFASKAPKPFFITTDGNYEWLDEFGADPNAHVQVSSWAEAKKAFEMDFKNYETIVIDLTEDLFKWCEHEYCIKNRLEHVSDVGYGKGYDTTRNEFFLEMCKLIGLDKHIIFIMHGVTYTVKDRRGVEHTKHGPTTRMPDKVIDMLEGRVRYFLRCYLKAEETEDNQLIKKRYLSLIPKENEFGIIRGIDENKVPHDIPLDFDTFANYIGLFNNVVKEDVMSKPAPITEAKKDIEPVTVTVVNELEGQLTIDDVATNLTVETENLTVETTEKIEQPKPVEASNDDKLDAIKAKLAALKAGQ